MCRAAETEIPRALAPPSPLPPSSENLGRPRKRPAMGACCSCFCCPVCTICGTACSVPCATCCDYSGLAWLERDSTLIASVSLLVLGVILHLVMTVKCAALHDTSWSPLPTHYENGPCFSAEGDNSYASHGFFQCGVHGRRFPVYVMLHLRKSNREEAQGATTIAGVFRTRYVLVWVHTQLPLCALQHAVGAGGAGRVGDGDGGGDRASSSSGSVSTCGGGSTTTANGSSVASDSGGCGGGPRGGEGRQPRDRTVDRVDGRRR